MPHPLLNTVQCSAQDWQITGIPGRLVLQTNTPSVPQGWVLIRGHLQRSDDTEPARLFAVIAVRPDNQTHDHRSVPSPMGERARVRGAECLCPVISLNGYTDCRHTSPMTEFVLPVTRKGKILELIKLPVDTHQLILQPMTQCGTLRLQNFVIKPVTLVERLWRMGQRVIPVYWNQPRLRRRQAGLSGLLPILNPTQAYRIASRFRGRSPGLSYTQWITEFDTLTAQDRRLIYRHYHRWPCQPQFFVLIDARTATPNELQRSLDALVQQVYPAAQIAVLCAADHVPKLSEEYHGSEPIITVFGDALDSLWSETVSHDSAWLLCLEAGMQLAQHALYWWAYEAQANPHVQIIYADHDHLTVDGQRCAPVFKPDWSPYLLRSSHYIGHALALRLDVHPLATLVAELHQRDLHALWLRLSENLPDAAVRHIPAILLHCPAHHNMIAVASYAGVVAHLHRLGIQSQVEITRRGHCRIRYALPQSPPKVSIIIPTRDGLTYLQACIESLRQHSTYPNYDIVVVNNNSTDPATLAYLTALPTQGIRVLHYAQAFNYSAINNFAVEQVDGEVLCLLNNDTEVITPDWLEELIGHLLQPQVGVVGAKLLFSDGRVQHAGDAVGPGGCADHLHSKIARDDPGYQDRAILAQEYSAVTAACLVTWRDLYRRLGGLDAVHLAVAFNDVDYCLRVREAGYRVLWTPYAQLYHHESVSRGQDINPEQQARSKRESHWMRQRWRAIMHHDPFYNPNLNYNAPDFSMSHAPMVKRPWR